MTTMGWEREPTQWLEMDGCRLPYWRLGQGPGGVRGRAPLLGEHSDRVLREILALPEEDILRLRESGIFD